jgi:hypothetical protein
VQDHALPHVMFSAFLMTACVVALLSGCTPGEGGLNALLKLRMFVLHCSGLAATAVLLTAGLFSCGCCA